MANKDVNVNFRKFNGENYLKVSTRSYQQEALKTKKEFEKNSKGKLLVEISPFRIPEIPHVCYYLWARPAKGQNIPWKDVPKLAFYGVILKPVGIQDRKR
jgi:hypothetical protein